MTTSTEALIAEHRGVIGSFGDMSPIGNLSRRTVRELESTGAELATLRALRDRWQKVVGTPDFMSAVEAEARAYHDSACIYQVQDEEGRTK